MKVTLPNVPCFPKPIHYQLSFVVHTPVPLQFYPLFTGHITALSSPSVRPYVTHKFQDKLDVKLQEIIPRKSFIDNLMKNVSYFRQYA